MLYLILLILGIETICSELAMIITWINARFQKPVVENKSFNPKACVIVPCKGIGDGFKENINAIVNQDYKNFKVIFVTDSKDDLAYKTLKKMFDKKSNIKIVLSRFIRGSSGKISALISGVKNAGDTEIYVFADSDIKPHKKWLRFLITPLKDKKIGATTGYRWYFTSDFRTFLLSAWNMASSISLFYKVSNYTWGGSTAIRKEVFEKLDIIEKWKKGFSDDLILTNALRKNKYKIRFIAQCVVESPPEGDIKFIVKWGTRQLTWVKWYYPLPWIGSVIGAVGLKLAFILGFFLVYFGFTIPGLLMISSIFFEIVAGIIAYTTMKKLMYYPKERYRSPIYYGLLMPVVLFIFAYNNLGSIFKREIKWGGRTYSKKSLS